MKRGIRFVLAIASFSGLFTFAPAHAQQPAASSNDAARFEAVSIRRHTPGSPQGYYEYPGGRILSRGQRIVTLISRAYGLRGNRVIGGPEWIRSDLYTVETAATGEPDDAQLRVMLRHMLAERFKLVVHADRRDMPSYVMSVARAGRLGPSLKPRTPACERGKPVSPETISLTMLASGPALPCGARGMGGSGLAAVGVTMPWLAQTLDNLWLNEPVVDRTGLTGEYDLVLTNVVNQWTNDPLKAEADDPDSARLPVALEEQLGLKLELRREAADVVVIDRVERPSEN